MITTALLMVLMPAATAPQPIVAQEITVIGERLKTWRGRIAPAGDAIACATTRSTGDHDLDRIGCQAMVACATPLRTRLEAAAGLRPRQRKVAMAAVEQELGTCMMARRDALAAELADRRHQERTNAQD